MMPVGRPKGPIPVITKALGEELMGSYTTGTSPVELSRYCREVHGLRISSSRISTWLKKQFQARSVASMRAVGPKVELVMGDEIDKLLRFRDFCEAQFIEIWRNLPEWERYNSKNAFKFLEAMQKAQAQIFMVNGLNIVSKAGTTMDELTRQWDEKLDRYLNAAKEVEIKDSDISTDAGEEAHPQRDE